GGWTISAPGPTPSPSSSAPAACTTASWRRSMRALPRRGGRRLRAAALAWLLLVVAVPLAALARDAFRGGWENFWNALTLPTALAALRLTLWTAGLAAAVNAVLGTM